MTDRCTDQIGGWRAGALGAIEGHGPSSKKETGKTHPEAADRPATAVVAAAQMVEAIVRDQKRIFPVCAWLQGEYDLKDIYLGVPVVLGKNGIEKIIELDLNADEKALLAESVEAVRNVMGVLDNMDVVS